MYDSRSRRAAADDNSDSRQAGLLAQPDRVALWAVFLAILAMVACAASAHAGTSGGIDSQSGGASGGASAGGSNAATPPPPSGSGLEWLTQRATWYGPGFFGNKTACGKTLARTTVGVAHRTLPCGTRVVLRYEGERVRTRVIDRGPFANGAKWDLTQAAAKRLGFEYTDDIQVARLPE